MFKQPKYFILLIILVGSFLFFTQTLTVLALEERTSSVTSPYGFYQNDTGSYWDPMGGTIQGPEGLISKGNIDVLHRGEIGIEKKTVSVGDTIPFVYNPDKPFFTASGGLWDTPYGSWCAGINDRCFNDITSVGLYITSVYGNEGYVYFTGVKPPVELVSSDPAVLTCSGFSCLAKSPGQSQVIMKIGYTPIRGWARIHYRNFGVFSPEAIRNNYITSVSVWSDVSEVGAYVTAYSYTNPRFFPSTKYGEVGPYEIITLNKTDFIESPEGSAIISNLNNVLVYSFFVYGGSSPDDIANFVMIIMAGSINIDSTTIKKIVNDVVANGLGYSQDFKPIIKSALPEDITFSRLVSLQNQGYNDMVLPKTTLGPWTITVKNPDSSNKPPSFTVTATSPVKIGQDSTVTMTADDPEGDSVKYCVSWNGNDSYDEKATASTDFVQDEGCFPSIGFIPNKESREVKQSWRSIGDKKVKVVAFDDKGNKSDWKEATVKVEDNTNSCVKSNGGVEICDSKDNDCNGIVDDGNPGGGGQCTASGLGQCRVGINQCIGGNLLCVGAVPSQEICGNNKDEDCDGSDLSCPVTPPSTPKCNNNNRCETYRGENPVNCPKDCPSTIKETQAPKPSFMAFVLGALGLR